MSSSDGSGQATGAFRRRKAGALVLVIVLLSVLAGAWLSGALPFSASASCGLTMVKSIPLSNAGGRLDHMAFDPGTGILYVAALGNGSVDVVNTTSGRLLNAVGGLNEPQGVLLVPGGNQLYVSSGGDGVVSVLDPATLRSTANVSLGSDADNMRYDAGSNLVWVGYGQGGVSAIEAGTGSVVANVPLSGHPESFQLDVGTGLMYVNVPSSGYVAVVNLTRGEVVDRWPLSNSSGNYPMALDAGHSRLFIGTRSPAFLLVYDTTRGTEVARIPVPQDPDDVYFDGTSGCIFVSSGAGYVTAIKQVSPSRYSIAGQTTTSAGARTSLLVVGSGLYFVAAPSDGSNPARIIEYKVT